MKSLILPLVLCFCSIVFSGDVLARQSVLGDANAVRIAEANHLLRYLQGTDEWDWDHVPFAILLLTEEKDYLVGHPYPSDDFVSEGIDPVIGMEVFSRPRTEAWSLQFLATFPAVNGLPTVVVGTAEATGRSSTSWVVTLLHEHFHQIQYGWSNYQDNVAALDLDGGDTSGMWMLNYPFPYGEQEVVSHLGHLAESLAEDRIDRPRVQASLSILKTLLSEADYRYLTFQFWQEGTARYMEHVVARMASSGYVPTEAFQELDDAVSYSEHAQRLDAQLQSELENIDVAAQGRLVMYPLGAAIGMLLERENPEWTAGYFNQELSTLRLLDKDLQRSDN